MNPACTSDFITVDETTLKILVELERCAKKSYPILLYGETGAGKDVAARQVHKWSNRSDKPFVALNCATLQESLVESELFGHEKGAFTNAIRARRGAFELAHGGTLFLDELGELPLSIQAKLLRVLETWEVSRVGSEKTIPVDVRIIAATNRDLAEEVSRGRFRQDLYYRLDSSITYIPPLRNRLIDIAPLSAHFLKIFSAEFGCRTLTGAALEKLLSHSWPGNVRELRSVLQRAATIACDTEIGPGDIRFNKAPTLMSPASEPPKGPPRRSLREMTQDVFEAELKRNSWNRRETARNLGISRSTVKDRIKRYGLQPPGSR